MLHNSFQRLLTIIAVDVRLLPMRYSALFINGPKATDTFAYVSPYINFPELLNDKDKLQETIIKRKSPIDLNKLKDLWYVYEELKQKKLDLEKKKDETAKQLADKLKLDANLDDINKLKIQTQLIKDNLKVLKFPLWYAEEIAVTEALKLPNILHPNTPENEDKVVYTYLSPPTSDKNHVLIGKENLLIKFEKNHTYYLLNGAAIYELSAKFYTSQCLRNANYIQFSNPDFVKSVIIEGCGEDHTSSDSTFILHHNEDSKVNIDSRLHLTGGGSLYSFFAYHGKNIINSKTLPLKYFTIGRQYTPSQFSENSLFHTSQSSVIQFFGVTRDEHEADNVLEELSNMLKNIYSNLGHHFRLTILSADKLKMNESLKISIEMYSTSLRQYIEIGYIAVIGNFISKRLMFTYVDKDKNKNFPHIIHGTVLNTPRLIGCILEQDGDFNLPDCLKTSNWSM